MQTIAWSTMFASNQREVSVGEALEMTFGGEHPCGMCEAIAKGMGEEDSDQPARGGAEWTAVLAKAGVLPPRSSGAAFSLEFNESSGTLPAGVIVPPPWRA